MQPLAKLVVTVTLFSILSGCVHKPPVVIHPQGPVIDYGRPGAVSR